MFDIAAASLGGWQDIYSDSLRYRNIHESTALWTLVNQEVYFLRVKTQGRGALIETRGNFFHTSMISIV